MSLDNNPMIDDDAGVVIGNLGPGTSRHIGPINSGCSFNKSSGLI